MLRYVAGRLLQAIIAVFGVLTIVFIVMRFSGDPTLLLVPEGASPESIDALRTELGFDRPVIVQYIDYLRSLSHLDFGVSVVQRIPAFDIVASRIPYTVLLATGALVIMLGWLPTSGAGDLKALVMPSIALGALSMSTFARMARIAIVDELGKDYVRAGRARGLSLPGIVWRHVLRNAAIPVVTIAALEIGNLLAGAVIVETVFAWPGIGQLAIQSIQSRDFLVVQVIVLLISFVYVATSLLADVMYAFIDPRIRLAG
jgi:peptide/nickel transport system permease protein